LRKSVAYALDPAAAVFVFVMLGDLVAGITTRNGAADGGKILAAATTNLVADHATNHGAGDGSADMVVISAFVVGDHIVASRHRIASGRHQQSRRCDRQKKFHFVLLAPMVDTA
jgi:hypothetical protein